MAGKLRIMQMFAVAQGYRNFGPGFLYDQILAETRELNKAPTLRYFKDSKVFKDSNVKETQVIQNKLFRFLPRMHATNLYLLCNTPYIWGLLFEHAFKARSKIKTPKILRRFQIQNQQPFTVQN
jgi:hypothetical protein